MPAAAMQRCMRFTVLALACSAACLGFATGLAKAPSHGLNSRTVRKASSIGMRGGPLRGLEHPAAEVGNVEPKAWQVRGKRFMSALRGEKEDAVGGGGDGMVSGSSGEGIKVRESGRLASWVESVL